jgi:hypothetical protein
MASVVIAGNTSGTVTLSAPDIAGSTVLTLPTTSGTLVTTAGGTTVPFALGSAASPSITFTGDTNTGIFSPGADSIGFAEGGAEVARFDSSGQFNVGPFGGGGNAVVAGSSSPSFTNQPGTNLLLKSGDGSGTGSSFMSFSTSPAGSSGTTVNTAVERMRIDSSGRVGIGTSSPGSYDSSSLMAVASNANTSITVASGSTGLGQILFANGTGIPNIYNGLIRYDHNGNAMSFFTNGGNQRMIIDSSGKVFIGQTSAALSERLGVTNSSGQAFAFDGSTGCGRFTNDDLNHYSVIFQSKAGTSATHFQIGFFNSAGSTVGAITHNNSNTTYATSSDYRLKEKIAPMTGALAVVGQLKPCTYTWKSTGETSQGFIAHELQEIVPDCVVGEKDAVNEDGSIKPQGIDTSFLVATLTAAIQEQQAIINEQASTIAAFEARLVALENK